MIDFKTNEIFSNIIFIYGIMGIPSFHIFNKPKYLILEKPYSLIVKALIAVAIVFCLLYFNNIIPIDIFLLTLSPFYQILLYRCSYFKFLEKMKRTPKDVAFNFNTGLFFDRVFVISYVMLAIMVPLIIILNFK